MRTRSFTIALGLLVAAAAQAQANLPFKVEPIASFDEPWALAFLPDGRMLVTEKKGNLLIVTPQGEIARKVGGVPDVDYGGQGGLGDVALHPQFARNRLVYLSFAEGGPGGTRGAAVVRGVLEESEDAAQLSNVVRSGWRLPGEGLGTVGVRRVRCSELLRRWKYSMPASQLSAPSPRSPVRLRSWVKNCASSSRSCA